MWLARTLVGVVVAVGSALPGAWAQSNVGFGNSGTGSFTPQPTGANALSAEIQQGFSDAGTQLNSQLQQQLGQTQQQATGAIRGAVDSLGRAITQPIDNTRQMLGDVISGPSPQGAAGQPAQNVLDRTASEFQNTGDALKDAWNRAGQNTREMLGMQDPNRAPATTTTDPLATPPRNWNSTVPAASTPTSWGTASDPLASPPALSRTAEQPGSNFNTQQPTSAAQPSLDTRPSWSTTSNTTTDPLLAPPALRPGDFNSSPQQTVPQQQPQQPATPSQQPRVFDSFVDRNGPTLVDPSVNQRQFTPVPGGQTTPTSGFDNTANAWGQTPVTTGFGFTDPLAQQPGQIPPLMGQTPATPVGMGTIPEIRTTDTSQPNGNTSGAVETWLEGQRGGTNGNQQANNIANVPTADPIGPLGWAVGIAVLFGSAAGNLYQWFNILDLRNKYRVALRRNSPSLARTLNT